MSTEAVVDRSDVLSRRLHVGAEESLKKYLIQDSLSPLDFNPVLSE
jgi:hypothetical protein